MRTAPPPDLPFEELSPADFHRLVLHLLVRSPEFSSVESRGATEEADGGIDICASRAAADTRTQRVGVQVKRTKTFTKREATTEVDRLRRSGASAEIDLYLLVTACIPTAAAVDEMRNGLAELGVFEVIVWDRSLLTALAVKYADVARFFFGFTVGTDASPENHALFATVRRLLGDGHPLVLLIGGAWERELSERSEIGEDPIYEVRTLIETGTSRVLCTTGAARETLIRGMTDESAQQVSAFSSAAESRLASDLTAALHERSGERAPVLVALWLTETDFLELERDGCGWRDAVATFAHAGAAAGTERLGDVLLLNPYEVLRSLQKMVSEEWLAHRLRKLDFDDHAPEDALSTATTLPGVGRWGWWGELLIHRQTAKDLVPGEIPEHGFVPISAPAGSGKTSLAYHLAFCTTPESTYYLDLAAVDGATRRDLVSLVDWAEVHRPGSTLILDNGHTVPGGTGGIRLWPRKSNGHPLLQVIWIETTPLTSGAVFGGEQQTMAGDVTDWYRQRQALTKWAGETFVGGVDGTDLAVAATEARNVWHFMYLLRGGGAAQIAELHRTRTDDHRDIAWCAVAALQVFQQVQPTLRDVLALLERHGLRPLNVSVSDVGPWLVEALRRLIEDRLLVADSGRLACRHTLEAYGVVRFSFDSDSGLTTRVPRDVIADMFKEALPPLAVPPDWTSDPASRKKRDFRFFNRDSVSRYLARQRELEQAVSYTSDLHEHVEDAWAAFTYAVEHWPVHNLYWLFNDIDFAAHALRFSPFRRIAKIPALSTFEDDSGAVDFVYLAQGLLGLEALVRARDVWRIDYRRQAVDRMLDQAAKDVQLLEDLGNQGPLLKTLLGHLRVLERAAEDLSQHRKRLTTHPIGPIDEVAATAATLGLALSPSAELADADAYALERFAVLLARRVKEIGDISASTDPDAVLRQLKTVSDTARSLVIVHVWLLAPALGDAIVARLSPEWQRTLVRDLRAAVEDDSKLLHLYRESPGLVLFAAAQAEHLPALATWIAAPRSQEFGRLARVARAWPRFGRHGLTLGISGDGPEAIGTPAGVAPAPSDVPRPVLVTGPGGTRRVLLSRARSKVADGRFKLTSDQIKDLMS